MEKCEKEVHGFDIRQEWGTHYWLQASLQVGKHTMRENIGVIGNYGMFIPGLHWALCRLYASFATVWRKFTTFLPFVLSSLHSCNPVKQSIEPIVSLG
jgi:hypothetical protein